MAGVATDAEDRVYLYTRDTPRVIVYDRDGKFLKSWGEGHFHDRPAGSAHGITDRAGRGGLVRGRWQPHDQEVHA